MCRFTKFASRRTIPGWIVPCCIILSCVQLEDEGVSRTWREPERLNLSGLFADVAIDPSGNAVAVWSSPEDAIFARHRFAGDEAEWGAREKLSTDGTSVGSGLSVGMDTRGSSVAVWSAFFAEQNVWTNRASPDGTWTHPSILDDRTGDPRPPPDTGPDIAVGPSGVSVAVWVQVAGDEAQVWAARTEPGRAWEPAARIDDRPAISVRSPTVAVDPEGNALTVWAVDDGVDPSIRSRRYTSAEGWAPETEQVSPAREGVPESPRIGFDASGQALAVWSEHDGARHAIWASRYSGSDGWAEAVPLDPASQGDDRWPDLAVASSGRAIAVWSHTANGGSAIRSSSYDGGRWSGPRSLPSSELGVVTAPRVGIATSGEAVAVWRRSDSAGGRVWASASARSGPWLSSSEIDVGEGNSGEPRIAVDESGAAVAIWVTAGVNRGVWVSRFE